MSKTITVYEHQSIKLNQEFEGFKFDANTLHALHQYSGSKGVPYYSLIHNGVRFNEYVGVIQVGNTVIEVLPKSDNNLGSPDQDKTQWRNLLIGMLRATGEIEVHSTSNSNLKLQANSVLDLYFERFIKEIEWLLHSGLIKQYRKKTSNLTTLKGNLLFSKNIQHNIVHAERFFVSHTTYDLQHLIHVIIYKTIRVLSRINTNNLLKGRISALLLNFPEMPDQKVDASTFERIVFTRKNQSYQNALSISKLLLLRLHPDIVNGKNDVLALMFDMNVLWEKFVYKSLRKHKQQHISVKDQVHKYFWESQADKTKVKMIPDIVIKDMATGKHFVLDTKWKNLNGKNPSPEDLRQLYVYHKYFEAEHVALIYPGRNSFKSGIYLDNDSPLNRCSVICLEIEEGKNRIDLLQKQISDFIQEKITSILKVEG
jgi:5-methylcytosine-specific restriction enzyme subunit McrC